MRSSTSGIMSTRTQFTREELDYQYSPSRWSTRLPAKEIVDAHISVCSAATEAARQSVRCELGIEYAEPGGPRLDIYHPSTSPPDAGQRGKAVFVYIHGGYWQLSGIENAGFSAVPLTNNGVTLVAIGYTLAPKVTMTTIVEQCRKAIVFIRKRFSDHRIFVGGHSAGGHLSVCMLITDWIQYGIETYPISGVVPISGIYDLDPVQRTHVNDAVNLTDEEVKEFSPLRQADRLTALPAGLPCLLVWGEEDSDEFKRQSHEYAKMLLDHGVACSSHEVTGADHFSIVENLQNESYSLTQMILKLIQDS